MNRVWSRPARYFTLSLMLIVLVAVGWYVRAMFPPLIIAGLIAYLLSPIVNFLKQRARLPHRVAVNIVYFLSLAVLLAIPATLVPVLLNQWDEVMRDVVDFPEQLRFFLAQPLEIGGYTLNLERFLPDFGQSLNDLLARAPESALWLLETASRNVIWMVLIVVTAYYLLLDWERVREWLLHLPPEPYQGDARQLYEEIRRIWSGYLRGQLGLMLALALIYSAAWFVIGLPGALILGALTGLLNIVPELGPFLAALLAVIVALIEGSYFLPLSNFWFAILVLALYLVLNYFKTIWLQPRILGHSVNLNQGVVFVALISALMIWGVLGVLIIIPVLASAVVIGRYLRQRIFGLEPFPPDEPSLVTEVAGPPRKPALRRPGRGGRRSSKKKGKGGEASPPSRRRSPKS